MKRYEDFKNESNETDYLTKEEMEKVKWTKYKIIVPTIEDKLELENTVNLIQFFNDYEKQNLIDIIDDESDLVFFYSKNKI